MAARRLGTILDFLVAVACAVVVMDPPCAGAREASSPPAGVGVRQVAELEVTGLPQEMAEEVEAGLALAPRGGFLTSRKQALTPGALEADRQRILLYLTRHGYPDATVTTEIEAQQDEKSMRVTFVVSSGDLVTYGEVALAGFPAAQAALAREVAERKLPGGAPFRDQDVDALQAELVRRLEEAAYPSPRVDVVVRRAAPGVAAVTLTAHVTQPSAFTSVEVNGVPGSIEPVARRVIDLEPGTPYSPEYMNRTAQALRDLNIFRRVDLKAVEVAPGSLVLQADLVIRPMVTARASVGSWTDEWIRVTAGWAHRNFFGRARGLELTASYSPHLIGAETRAWWPGLVTPRSRTDLGLGYSIEDEESYRLETGEISLTNLFSIDPKTSLRAGVAVSQGDLENRSADPEAFVDKVGLQTIFTGRWFRDSSNDALVPSVGHRLGFEMSVSVPGVLTENPFLLMRANEARYVPLVSKRLVLAGRLDLGVAWPLGEAIDLTPNHRFFAGGVSTMRGYRRRELGPRDLTGKPIGGEAQLLAGLELRRQLIGVFGVAAFVDAGQVWPRFDDVELSQIATAAGAGVMVTTPVGPIRLDVAYNLQPPPPGEPRLLVQVGIGHPY